MSHATVMVAVTNGAKSVKQIEQAVAEQLHPFSEENQSFQDGSRWDWYQIGGRWKGWFDGQDAIAVKDINLDKLKAEHIAGLTQTYYAAMNEKDPGLRSILYDDIPDGEELAGYLARHDVKFPATRAFLKAYHWNEGERMGWFGQSMATECDMKGEISHRCKATKGDGTVVTWNESFEEWEKKFYQRFIEPLEPSNILVVVDYHV